jgi:hypothetical protein
MVLKYVTPEVANSFFATTPLWGVVMSYVRGEKMK